MRWLLQSREREQRVSYDYRGYSRRIWSWTPWKTVDRFDDEADARLQLAVKRRFFSLTKWRLTWGGKEVT